MPEGGFKTLSAQAQYSAARVGTLVALPCMKLVNYDLEAVSYKTATYQKVCNLTAEVCLSWCAVSIGMLGRVFCTKALISNVSFQSIRPVSSSQSSSLSYYEFNLLTSYSIYRVWVQGIACQFSKFLNQEITAIDCKIAAKMPTWLVDRDALR
jgi:hypothetical protein